MSDVVDAEHWLKEMSHFSRLLVGIRQVRLMAVEHNDMEAYKHYTDLEKVVEHKKKRCEMLARQCEFLEVFFKEKAS